MAVQVPVSAADLSWLSTVAWRKMYCGVEIQFHDPLFEPCVHANGNFIFLMPYQNRLYHSCYMPIPLIAPVISGEQYNYDTHKLNTSLHPPGTSFHLSPDIPLSTLFSNSFSLNSLFRVRWRVFHFKEGE